LEKNQYDTKTTLLLQSRTIYEIRDKDNKKIIRITKIVRVFQP